MPAQAPAGAYSGSLEVARKSVAEEGVLVLWRGFTPAFVKLAPYSIISLTLLERCTSLLSTTWYVIECPELPLLVAPPTGSHLCTPAARPPRSDLRGLRGYSFTPPRRGDAKAPRSDVGSLMKVRERAAAVQHVGMPLRGACAHACGGRRGTAGTAGAVPPRGL